MTGKNPCAYEAQYTTSTIACLGGGLTGCSIYPEYRLKLCSMVVGEKEDTIWQLLKKPSCKERHRRKAAE